MSYVKNLELDEIRDGFLVTSDRKKLWNREIELILQLQNVCKKFGLKFWATDGTLLGAARHGGFIPWDDDADFAMFRSDYSKLQQIASREFNYPFFFDNLYENLFLQTSEPNKVRVPFSKIRDSRTFFPHPQYNQGIWIDIFPLDANPIAEDELEKPQRMQNFEIIRELYLAFTNPKKLLSLIQNPSIYKFLIHPGQLKEIASMSVKERGKILERYLEKLDFPSKLVFSYVDGGKWFARRLWDETTYLPFEEIMLPVPKDFDSYLQIKYGDWHEKKFTHSHAHIYSVDISYKKYFSMLYATDDSSERANSLDQNLHVDEMRDGFLVTFWKKKIWKKQLELVMELKRTCETFDLKFWTSKETSYAVKKFHGFNPRDDFLTFEMSQEDFDKLEFNFPYRLTEIRGGGANFSTIQPLSSDIQTTKIVPKEFLSRSGRAKKIQRSIISHSNLRRFQCRKIRKIWIASRENSTEMRAQISLTATIFPKFNRY